MKAQLDSALRDTPLFSDLSEEQRIELARSASVREYPRGTEIFSVGEPAESFLLVLSGAVKAYLLSADGREQILHTAGPGDLVAEGPVFAQATYPASVMATQDAQVVHFYRDQLLELLREDPELAFALIAGLYHRLEGFVHTIEDLSLRDVTGRLARFLLQNAHGDTCKLPGTKTELAAQLGTVLEPLSRAFRKLREAGIIEERKHDMRILDGNALRSLVLGVRPRRPGLT